MADRIVWQVKKGIDHVRIRSEQHHVILVKHRSVVAVPHVFRNLHDGVVELLRRSLGMVIHPMPHCHINQGHARDFIRSPKIIQNPHRLTLRIGSGKPEQFEVPCLEHERQCLRERGIGNTFQKRVIHSIKRKSLLYVVPHLVNCNVESLVIHAAFADARAQVGFLRPHGRPHGMTGTASRIHHDILPHKTRPLRREAQPHKKIWNVLLVSLGRRISLGHNRVQLRFAVLAARTKAAVPDIKGLQRSF